MIAQQPLTRVLRPCPVVLCPADHEEWGHSHSVWGHIADEACCALLTRVLCPFPAGHEEWGHSHSVWGHIADEASWAVIDRVPMEPFTTITDKGGITTRWLTPNATIPFKLSTE